MLPRAESRRHGGGRDAARSRVSEVGEGRLCVSGACDRLRSRFEAAQERFGDFCVDAKKKIISGAKRTDEVIRSNPYQSLAIALGVGLLLGVVVARRK